MRICRCIVLSNLVNTTRLVELYVCINSSLFITIIIITLAIAHNMSKWHC